MAINVGDRVTGRDRSGQHKVTGRVLEKLWPSGQPGYYTTKEPGPGKCRGDECCIFKVVTDVRHPDHPNEMIVSWIECAELAE